MSACFGSLAVGPRRPVSCRQETQDRSTALHDRTDQRPTPRRNVRGRRAKGWTSYYLTDHTPMLVAQHGESSSEVSYTAIGAVRQRLEYIGRVFLPQYSFSFFSASSRHTIASQTCLSFHRLTRPSTFAFTQTSTCTPQSSPSSLSQHPPSPLPPQLRSARAPSPAEAL